MTADEVIFLLLNSQKNISLDKHFCFRFSTIVIIFFCLQMWKGLADSKKTQCLSKEEIKKQLFESMIIDEVVEFDDLNKEAKEVQDPEKAAEIITRYEDIIKAKKKGIISVAYHQGQVFKRFKEKEKFAMLVSELEIHKTTIIF